MEFFTDEVIRGLLSSSLETAALGADGFTDVGDGPGSSEGSYIDWLTIADTFQSVVDDVARIRAHPLVPGRIPVYGYVYDVRSGRLLEVEAATKAGAAISSQAAEPRRPRTSRTTAQVRSRRSRATSLAPEAVADEVRSWIVEHWDADLAAGRVAPPAARLGLGLPDVARRVARAGPAGLGRPRRVR